MIRLMHAILLTSFVAATLSVEGLEAQADTKEDTEVGHDENNSQGPKETNGEIDQVWIDAIRDAFLKIGIKPEELPEPFGPKENSNITISPEYAKVIKKIIGSVPNDLRESLETMIKNATINIDQNNGTVEEKATSRLQKIAEMMKLIEAVEHLMNHTNDINNTTNNGDKNEQNISKHDGALSEHVDEIGTTSNPTDETTFKHANKNEKRTFCDEKEGPCEESDDEESNNEIDADEKELDELIEELRHLVSELPPQDNLQGQKDLDFVQKFLKTHYLSKHVDNMDNNNNGTHHNPITKSTHDIETTTETAPVITSITTPSLAKREQFIQDRMKESGSPTDVTIVGNSQKEVGAQLGKIAAMNHERRVNATPENKKAESSAIANLFQDIDKSAKEVGKQDLEAFQQVAKNGNHTKEMLKTINLHSILVSGLEDERDDEKVKSNQNEHDKHKKTFIDNIKSLRFTGDPETDAQKIKKILAIIAAIEREHRDSMELNKIMSSKNNVKKSHKKNKKREKEDADKLANNLLGTAFKGQDVSISKRYRKKKVNKINHNFQQHERKSKIFQESEMDKKFKEENEIEDKPTYYYDDDEYEDEYYPEDPSPQNEQTKDFVNNVNKKDEAPVTKGSEIQDEVNFNGGFDMSIENLKEQFPSGHWPQDKNTVKINNGKQKSPEGRQYSGRPVPIHVLSRPYENPNDNDDNNNYNSDASRSNELGYDTKESDRVIHILDHGPESPTDIGQLNPSNLEEIIRQQQGQKGITKSNKHHVQEHQILNKRAKRNLLQKFQQVKIGLHL